MPELTLAEPGTCELPHCESHPPEIRGRTLKGHNVKCFFADPVTLQVRSRACMCMRLYVCV
jgi:hypothetical protein